jgi:hypothetical protein
MPMQEEIADKLREELEILEEEYVTLDGKLVKPSTCYRLETDPPHILYNTNCPENLKSKVEAILLKHTEKKIQ